jgi:hypothetical protein
VKHRHAPDPKSMVATIMQARIMAHLSGRAGVLDQL